MEIKILQLIEGARKAAGLTVIIDVFRAFSTACYVFEQGAKMIIPVGDLEIARQLKNNDNRIISLGERDGKTLPGFDYGNSPALIRGVGFTGKTVVHTTSAGTQGIVNAEHASEIITGSFVNARAVASYICQQQPARVSLVCMGIAGVELAAEDIICAEYLAGLIKKQYNSKKQSDSQTTMQKNTYQQPVKISYEPEIETPLKGTEIFEQGKIRTVLKNSTGKRFFDPANQAWSPEEDFELCLAFNKFNFVLRAVKYQKELFCLQPLNVENLE